MITSLRLAAQSGEASSFGMATRSTDTESNHSSPVDALESWFVAHGWQHERLGDDEIVASAQGSWGQYELRGVWRDDDSVLQFLAFPDVRVAEGSAAAIYETIGLINEQLWLGHFELWASTGVLVFRHAVLLDGQEDPELPFDQAEILIETAVDELDRFYPVFQFVLWGGKSPREAIDAAMIETRGEA
ncbi:MAG: hypothetical protein RIS52_534 [Pseudomonadota bacterium]